MELINQISLFVFILFGGSYAVLIILFTIGWFRLKNEKKAHFKEKVSVLIPVRNGAQTIAYLLDDLKKQSVSYADFEILIIDDHSEDETFKLVSEFSILHPEFPVQLIENIQHGKKEAITFGLSFAKGEVILCVDADCRIGSEWIASMRSSFGNSKLQMVSGPVTYFKEKSFFKNIQSLEFLSLITSGAGAIGMKLAFMCNGANVAFRKKAFEEVNGYEGNAQFASGDDVFLLHKIKNQFGSRAIAFIKDVGAIVETSPTDTFKSFLQQRKRWASKSRAYKDFFTLFTSISVAGFSLMLIVFALLSLYNNQFILVFLMGMGLKIVIDFTLLMAAATFFKRKTLMRYYIPIQLVYPLYTALVFLLAFFTKNEWKGRKIN